MFSAESISRDLKEIRTKAPLIHNITNYVVMNLTANALAGFRRLAGDGSCG